MLDHLLECRESLAGIMQITVSDGKIKISWNWIIFKIISWFLWKNSWNTGLIEFLDDWKFIVSLRLRLPGPIPWYHACAGSIINKWQVITAAHCFFDPFYKKTNDIQQDPNNWRVVPKIYNLSMETYGQPDDWTFPGQLINLKSLLI